VLSASEAKARRVASESEAEAVALVLEQQNLAQSLLSQETKDSSKVSASKGDARDLLKSHRTAAELLAATEREVATKLVDAKTNAAVDVLMAGHREASAILLDAWMKVTEGRPSARHGS
jgi:hypothetical protein